MKITYELTSQDLIAAANEMQIGTSFYMAQLIISTSVFVLFIIADFILVVVAMFKNDGTIRVTDNQILVRAIVGGVILFGSAYVLSFIGRRSMKKFYESPGKNGSICEHTITLDERGFTEMTEVNESFHKWESVEKIGESTNFVLIYVRLAFAYFIPKGAFADDRSKEEFVQTARNHLSNATRLTESAG